MSKIRKWDGFCFKRGIQLANVERGMKVLECWSQGKV